MKPYPRSMENNVYLSTGLFFCHISLQAPVQFLVVLLRIVLSKLLFFHVVLNTYLTNFANLYFLICSIFLPMFSKSLNSGNFDPFFPFFLMFTAHLLLCQATIVLIFVNINERKPLP